MACPIIAKGDILEDPANEPKDMFVMSVEPEDAPNTPAYLEIGIEPGYPLSLNGNNSRHLVHSCSIAVWSKGTSGCSLESMIWIFCHSSICKLPRQESRSGFQKSSMAPTMKTLFRPLFGRRYSGWDISPPRNSFSSRA